MKNTICFITLLFISIYSYPQIQYALVLKKYHYDYNHDVILKNGAILSYALLKVKGDDWYKKNIIDICNQQSLDQLRFRANLYLDYFYVFNEYTPNNELFIESLISAFNFISKNKLYVFIESSTLSKDKNITKELYIQDIKRFMSDSFCYAQECKRDAIIKLNSNKKLSNYQFEAQNLLSKGKPIITSFINIFSEFPYMILLRYKSYKKKQIENNIIPLSQIEWIKKQIDYYMNLHIESSLDYGIDNSAFMIN